MGGFLPVPDPVAFTLFGVAVMWYGVCVTGGMVSATVLSYKRAPFYGIDPEKVLDFVLVVIPSGVVCARLYYVVFEWENYRNDLLQIFNIRGGGLAIHGGIIGGVLAAFILAKIWKCNALDWLDLVAPGIALGQAIGRWGNYFNSEAHGGPCTLPWAIECQGQLVHPTFLYESIWCLALCIFLVVYEKKHRSFKGQIFLMYAAIYSVERYMVESLRTDSLMIGPLRQAQVISFCTIALSVMLMVVLRRKLPVKPGCSAENTPAEPAEKPEPSEETAASESGCFDDAPEPEIHQETSGGLPEKDD